MIYRNPSKDAEKLPHHHTSSMVARRQSAHSGESETARVDRAKEEEAERAEKINSYEQKACEDAQLIFMDLPDLLDVL